ncbi:hypothetical protein [Gordonia sp. (in: high G+C Gram-positive bacteria)]|uniref:hypothetical protein n=1 Tax=Gordonia sp. (in: high G+C Gram-positive bacteria) TaxID=84139 RepID=UPI00333FE9E6
MASTDTTTVADPAASTGGKGRRAQAAHDHAQVREPEADQSADRPVSVWSVLALIAGSAILIVAAINLPNLGRWGDEHGNVLVFLCFFLVMSIGGRWFWAGVDALWGAIRGKGN